MLNQSNFAPNDSPRKARGTRAVSTKVEKRLASYALAAATAAGLIVAPESANASIVYTPATITLTNGTLNIDLNGDGIADFTLVDRIKVLNSYSNRMLGVTGFAGASVVESSNGGAAGLKMGSYISAGRAFLPVARQRATMASVGYQCNTASGCHSFVDGEFTNVKNVYLGFKFVINGQTHYGWARINENYVYQMHGKSKIKIYLSGYAYETNPDTAIRAGQTGLKDSAKSGASLGQLARGVAK
jgi:hypothetical protein